MVRPGCFENGLAADHKSGKPSAWSDGSLSPSEISKPPSCSWRCVFPSISPNDGNCTCSSYLVCRVFRNILEMLGIVNSGGCQHSRKQNAAINGTKNKNGADQICAISLSEVGLKKGATAPTAMVRAPDLSSLRQRYLISAYWIKLKLINIIDIETMLLPVLPRQSLDGGCSGEA